MIKQLVGIAAGLLCAATGEDFTYELQKEEEKRGEKKRGWNKLPRVVFKRCGPACFEC